MTRFLWAVVLITLFICTVRSRVHYRHRTAELRIGPERHQGPGSPAKTVPFAPFINANGQPFGYMYMYCPSSNRDSCVTSNPQHPPAQWTARARFDDVIATTGWSFLEVETNPADPKPIQAWAAGYLEGYLTANRIAEYHANTLGLARYTPSPAVEAWVNENTQWTNEQIASNPGNQWWSQVALINAQLEGLSDGYNSTNGKIIPFLDFLFMNLDGDLDDITCAVNVSLCEYPANPTPEAGPKIGHCSAIVKLAADMSEVYVGHTSWDSYSYMTRVYKSYQLFNDSRPTRFTGYPAMLVSSDEYYQIGESGLIAMATEIGPFPNHTLYTEGVTTKGVVEFRRNLVANRLATSGPDWAAIFRGPASSGTYCNQWLIIDYSRFTPGTTPNSGFLQVVEQVPGEIQSQDITALLIAQTYFPSYNEPWFPQLYNITGWRRYAEVWGDYWTYNHRFRANIFRRDQSNVESISTLQTLMRYNNFKHDPLAQCANCTPPYTGVGAIAARADLTDPNGSFSNGGELDWDCFGGYDSKVTCASLHAHLASNVIQSPTYDEQPVFDWSTGGNGCTKITPHVGQPNTWNFPWLEVNWPSS